MKAGLMTYWRNLGTGAALAECAQESGWTRDAAELEAKLARLPPAQPCFECPSHDASGKLRVIAPQLGRLEFDSGVADAALFECALCGAKWGERLDQVGPGRRGRDFGFRARLDDREAHGTPRAGNGCDPGAGDSSSARILPRACEVWTLFSTSDDLG